MLNLLDDWQPGCFCAATIKLCDALEEEWPDEIVRTPAQWAWFAWEPRDNALPFVYPQGWGISLEDPLHVLAEELGEVALYLLKEGEADWVGLLDILLICDDSPPWLYEQIKARQQEKRRASHGFLREYYGCDSGGAFQHFMQAVLRPPEERNAREERELLCLPLSAEPRASACLRAWANGSVEFERREQADVGLVCTYQVRAEYVPLLSASLGLLTGTVPADGPELIQALRAAFCHWHLLIDWLHKSGVPMDDRKGNLKERNEC